MTDMNVQSNDVMKILVSRCIPDDMGVRGSAYLLRAHKLSSLLISYPSITTAMASKMPLCHYCQNPYKNRYVQNVCCIYFNYNAAYMQIAHKRDIAANCAYK